MHRLAATPGGWTPDTEGVIFVEQTPAPLVILTAADTDIQAIARAHDALPPDFPALRVVNLLQLQQPLTIDTYAEDVLEQAQVIVLRLLGGRAYWSYGLEVVWDTVQRTGAYLIVLPGDDRPDPDLMSHSTVALGAVDRLWRYFTEGGIENVTHALQFITDTCLHTTYQPLAPQSVPRVGKYGWKSGVRSQESGDGEGRGDGEVFSDSSLILPPSSLCPHPSVLLPPPSSFPVGVLFYRAHYLAGNTAAIDALCNALADRGLEPVPVFVASLREPDLAEELLPYFQPKDQPGIQVLLNTTSFSLAKLGEPGDGKATHLWERLDVPVLQVILSGGSQDQWQEQLRGLSPRDMAMNVALPEVDGCIISRAVSFKSVQSHHPTLETDVVTYEPIADRVAFVADLAANWVRLRQTPVGDRRVALILANYPNRDGRLANGVGLDTPASCVEILKAMQVAGYHIDSLPKDSDDLIRQLTRTRTNDPEGWELRPTPQTLSLEDYQHYFATLPQPAQKGILDRWHIPLSPTHPSSLLPHPSPPHPSLPIPHPSPPPPSSLLPHPSPTHPSLPIPGIQLGNVFIGIQPPRGYDLDPSLNYHAPDLEPPHAYLAFYQWVREKFDAQAIVHVGKHGNLEWLPGKSIALSENCYPEIALGALPHLYPFIVNDPGEGSQAKRRSQAVILDHLTPPLTRAELYGSLLQLEGLIDEYYEAQSLDPNRLGVIRDRITQLIQTENLHQDLGLTTAPTNPEDLFATLLLRADTYLCELKEAQIRDGLHIFGQCPQGRQLRDLVIAIARHPADGYPGLTRALATHHGLDLDPLTANLGESVANLPEPFHTCRTIGDVVEHLEAEAAHLVDSLLSPPPLHPSTPLLPPTLLPTLRQTSQELTHLLKGLDGRYVPAGPSGAPTRGRPEVLPTGRNFYSVDIRSLPTESAWMVGSRAAEALIERYTQEQGDYPQTLALSVWGTSTMRTGGDDIAEALALLGVRPVWDGASRRVVDFEILPLSVVGRPRVDVTLRISGFFRDAFANLIDLFHRAVTAVAALPETPEQNPLAARVQQETHHWQTAGLSPDQASQRSHYRIFGSKPGAYGAGLQGLIEAQNWQDDADLARAYINWSSYAYTGQGEGRAAPEAFDQRLRQMQVVLHNQDNREHDLLDSDDYYQFQGGLTVAVRSVQGQNPQVYFGDHSLPEKPRVRSLPEEIARVYRSRVVNPKWIAGVMRHGYKGAFEMAATVDYLFAYDATSQCVPDHLYQGIADAYLFDPPVQAFVQRHNPWALRDIAERLLEAHQRGLWQEVNRSTLDQLRALVHQAEAVIEGNP